MHKVEYLLGIALQNLLLTSHKKICPECAWIYNAHHWYKKIQFIMRNSTGIVRGFTIFMYFLVYLINEKYVE